MPSFIVCLNDSKTNWFLEWSTVVDAPTTRGMSRREFRKWYLERYGQVEHENLTERMERAQNNGTSSLMGDSLASLVRCNRAGKNETTLTLKQIVEFYCRNGGKGERPTGTEDVEE